jgi:hypothetical protein
MITHDKVGLSQLATAAWTNEKRVDARVSHITHAATSIEISYLRKKEMV